MSEVVFLVESDPEGGYRAQALGYSSGHAERYTEGCSTAPGSGAG